MLKKIAAQPGYVLCQGSILADGVEALELVLCIKQKQLSISCTAKLEAFAWSLNVDFDAAACHLIIFL